MTRPNTKLTRTGSRVEFKQLKRTPWTRLKKIATRVLDTSGCFGNRWSRERFAISSILLSVSHPNLLLHQDPVVPNALNRAREDALRHGRSKESFKTVNATLDHPNRIREGTEATSTSDTAGGRPTIQFVDVGTKFIDPKDRLHRMKESERRARVRSKNVSKRHLMVA